MLPRLARVSMAFFGLLRGKLPTASTFFRHKGLKCDTVVYIKHLSFAGYAQRMQA